VPDGGFNVFCLTSSSCENEFDANFCTTELHGSVVSSCPTTNSIGCCTVAPGPMYPMGLESCTYTAAATSAGSVETSCTNRGGTWVGTGLDVCPLPTGTFSSSTGLVAALCVAKAWHSDAFLYGIEFGLEADLQPDGSDASWSYSFVSPTTPCNIPGGSGNEKIQIEVDSDANTGMVVPGIRSPGSTCGTYTALTGEADSETVVPAAVALILPQVPSGTTVTWFASDPVEAASQVGYVGGSAQVWAVKGYWTVAGGDFMEVGATFDANGANPVTASLGPCNPTTYMCP